MTNARDETLAEQFETLVKFNWDDPDAVLKFIRKHHIGILAAIRAAPPAPAKPHIRWVGDSGGNLQTGEHWVNMAPPAPDTERSPTNDKPLHPTNGPFRWDPKHGNWVADLNGVFDLLAEQDRERERHAGQVSRLMAERDELLAALSRTPQVAETREVPAEWRADAYGYERRALYIGNAHVGSIMHSPPSSKYYPDQWRGWFMHDDEGDETGWFATADEARKSVELKLDPPRALASGADEKGVG